MHRDQDLAASISSGSFKTAGMIVIPCSIKTLSAIANSFNDNLLVRAASVTPLPRERQGVVLGSPASVRAFAYVIAGHAKHHLDIMHRRLAPG